MISDPLDYSLEARIPIILAVITLNTVIFSLFHPERLVQGSPSIGKFNKVEWSSAELLNVESYMLFRRLSHSELYRSIRSFPVAGLTKS
jgi:formate-dependent nitrite reductase membrane component NrfD